MSIGKAYGLHNRIGAKIYLLKNIKKLFEPITTIGVLKTYRHFADPVCLELAYSLSSLSHCLLCSSHGLAKARKRPVDLHNKSPVQFVSMCDMTLRLVRSKPRLKTK